MKLIMVTAIVLTLGASAAFAQTGAVTGGGTTTNGVLNNTPPMINNGTNTGVSGPLQNQQNDMMRNSDRYARSQNRNQNTNPAMNGIGTQAAPTPGTNEPTPLYEINPPSNGSLNTNH